MTTTRPFGISTHLYHDRRLSRDHLDEIAAHEFDAIEVFATRSHFDYHDAAAVRALASGIREAGLRLHSIHAPIVESFTGGKWGGPFSNAVSDESIRRKAVQEADEALNLAREIPAGFLVLHLGTPRGQKPQTGDNHRDAARRSIDEIGRLAAPLGVKLALEVIPNELSTASSLVSLLEEEIDIAEAGICMDFGHALLMGDVVESIETASGHMVTTHVHDNHGQADDHLVPFDGAIDWAGALTAAQKIGYEATFMFEVANTGSTSHVLERARRARHRFEAILGEWKDR